MHYDKLYIYIIYYICCRLYKTKPNKKIKSLAVFCMLLLDLQIKDHRSGNQIKTSILKSCIIKISNMLKISNN